MIATQDNNELGSTIETQQIATFVDDVQPTEFEKPLMASAKSWITMAEDSMPHEIRGILQRPIKVQEGELKTSFTVAHLKFPDILLQKSKNLVSKLDYFTFLRANVKVKMVFNATPFMSGKYWLCFSPFDSICNRGLQKTNHCNFTGYPGVEIDLASGAPVEIKIPYCSPLSHYNLLDTHSNMGEMFLLPLNMIQTGESPVAEGSGCFYTMFAWFEDIELAMPTSKPVKVPAAAFKAHMAKTEEKAATSGPPISGMLSSIAGTASAIGGAIPKLGSFVRPVEWVSRVLSGAASAIGWNKPTALDKVTPYINMPARGYTNADGIDLSVKLASMPDNGLTYDSGLFSTDMDEMDINTVVGKSTMLFSSIGWKTSDEVDSVIKHFQVAPGVAPSGAAGALGYACTLLAGISSIARYWRGGIKYRITAAKTAFHTGRLRITYHPGVYADSSPIADLVSENAYHWLLDLSVSSELEFTVPYVSNVPWKDYLLEVSSSTNWRTEKYSTGMITIEVLTRLRRASDSVADNCPINIWVAGAEDYSIAVFNNAHAIAKQTTTALPFTTPVRPRELSGVASPFEDLADEIGYDAFEPQPFIAHIFNQTSSAIDHEEQVEGGDSQNMFPISSMSPTDAEQLTIGEKVINLRTLIKRFSMVAGGYPYPYRDINGDSCLPGPIPLNNDNYLYNRVTIDPAYFGTADGTAVITSQSATLPKSRAGDVITDGQFYATYTCPSTNLFHFISYFYRFYRGSKRYKMSTPVTNDVDSIGTRNISVHNARPQDPLLVHTDTSFQTNGALNPPALGSFKQPDISPVFEHYVYPDLNGTVEFEAPYYAQTPISLVGEGTIDSSEGTLIKRLPIHVKRSHLPRGLDRPMYKYDPAKPDEYPISDKSGGIRMQFGGYTLYEAAGDDFSFGYLVGSPRIRRLADNP